MILQLKKKEFTFLCYNLYCLKLTFTFLFKVTTVLESPLISVSMLENLVSITDIWSLSVRIRELSTAGLVWRMVLCSRSSRWENWEFCPLLKWLVSDWKLPDFSQSENQKISIYYIWFVPKIVPPSCACQIKKLVHITNQIYKFSKPIYKSYMYSWVKYKITYFTIFQILKQKYYTSYVLKLTRIYYFFFFNQNTHLYSNRTRFSGSVWESVNTRDNPHPSPPL